MRVRRATSGEIAELADRLGLNFNTHHPAMSIPCGMSDGLPIGLMLVGRHFEEATIYRAAYAFEQHADWRTL